MKKVLAFILAALMVLSLAACQTKPTEKPDDGGQKTEAPTEKPTEKPTDKPADPTTQAPEPPKEVITVKYFCSIGAYLDTLTALVNEFNEGEGKEKGVYIDLESEIEDPTGVMDANVAAGNYPDIFTSANPNLERYAKGYYYNLYDVQDEELQQLIKNAQPYIDASFDTFGVSADHFLCSIPLEVLPIKMPINLDLFKEANLEEPKTWDDVLNAAEKITALGKEGTKGFGWSTWSAVWRRLTFKANLASARKAWWDPNTATYDWTQYRPVIEAEIKMFQEGWMLGADDLGIDPIRSEFSAGHVGMFVSPSYDYGVFTNQFPATCDWKFINMPVYKEGNTYKGAYFSRGGHAIFKQAYEEADQAKKDAIETAYCFIEGDYVVKKCAETGALIPFPGRFTDVDYSGLNPQFAQMADVEGFAPVPVYPDSIVTPFLDGADNYAKVFDAVMHGTYEGGLDKAFTDLADLYNGAYAKAKADPEVAPLLGMYEYDYVFKGE